MKHTLRPGMVCWEWGSGQSTLFIAQRVGSLTTVKHKNRWKKHTASLLTRHAISNTTLRHILPSNPKAEKICTADGTDYAAYVDSILKIPDQSLDFILVDGRARVRRVLCAMSKLKPQGFLLLDNSERPRYAPCLNALKQWPATHYSNGLQRTSIFQKPIIL